MDEDSQELRNNKSIEKSIKSVHILKLIFSFLKEKQKLNVIIYNKQLQQNLNINIENYKETSRRYKRILDKIGNGRERVKEYDIKKSSMIFEGEYLNGKRNGEGTEYYAGRGYDIKFKGEYLNGKRHGKGKKYFLDQILKYEGEYSNGKKNGKGKKYYKNGILHFEGEYLNGKKWNGKGYDKNGNLTFEIKDGNGKGKEYYPYGNLKFEGEYINGEKK